MRTLVAKFDVILDVAHVINSSSNLNDNVPELMKQLHEDVDSVVLDLGFDRSSILDPHLSRRNGGWAYYDTYTLSTGDSKIKLVINVRTSDHSSKPNLATKNKNRLNLLNKQVSNVSEYTDADTSVIDIYYEQRNWGAQYYIGKGDKYSDPVDSIDKLNTMLKGQLNKIKSKCL